MSARLTVLVVVAAAVTVTAVAAAGPTATKQRAAIDMKILPHATFVLAPLGNGALARDSGSITNVSAALANARSRSVMRDGQRVTVFNPVIWRLEGKRGTLTIRERNEWVDVGNDVNRDGQADGIGFGTWTVVRGTGQYAGLSGGGRNGHIGLGQVWYSRAEGFLRSP
jgi:hypothetical protein